MNSTPETTNSLEDCQAANEMLRVDIAIATRLIESSSIPPGFAAWLARPSKCGFSQPACQNKAAFLQIEELLTPLKKDAESWERSEIAYATDWLTALGNYFVRQESSVLQSICLRQFSAALLPLYRVIATGKLREGFEQTRLRLLETVCLIGIVEELGDELIDLIEFELRVRKTPSEALLQTTGIDLSVVARAIIKLIPQTTDGALTDEGRNVAATLDGEQLTVAYPDWAEDELLWRLAGELVAQRSDFVLPRSWINEAVPWNKIGDHWNLLEQALKSPGKSKSLKNASSLTLAVSELQQLENRLDSHEHRAELGIDALLADEDATSGSFGTPTQSINDEQDSAFQDSGPSEASEADEMAAVLEDLLPKVLVAEVTSHNDPAFVQTLQKQLGRAKSDNHMITLALIDVHPEEQQDWEHVRGKSERGLSHWQQQLVNWLSEHPEVVSPYAFVTKAGELMVCVLDMDRGEMTELVRLGLIETLTGQHFDDATDDSLRRVHVPAKFFGGISSCTTPSANTEASEMIERALNCLETSRRFGKSMIKSIEVY